MLRFSSCKTAFPRPPGKAQTLQVNASLPGHLFDPEKYALCVVRESIQAMPNARSYRTFAGSRIHAAQRTLRGLILLIRP
jgi:hypothetical protein